MWYKYVIRRYNTEIQTTTFEEDGSHHVTTPVGYEKSGKTAHKRRSKFLNIVIS